VPGSVEATVPGAARRALSGRALAAIAVVAIGISLRVLGIAWGLPDRTFPGERPFHPDEANTVQQVLAYAGDAIPGWFGWGGVLYFRTGYLLHSAVDTLRDVPAESEAATLLVALRLLNLVASLAAAGFVAWQAAMLAGRHAAPVAAGLLLFFPGHVLASHFARADVLMTAFCAAALALSSKAARTRSLRMLAVASAAAGLATATMIWGAAAFVAVAIAAIEGTQAPRLRALPLRALWIAAAGIGGYALGSIESFLHWEIYRSAFAEMFGRHGSSAWSPPLPFVTTVSLYAFGTAAVASAWVGVAVLVRERRPGSATLVGYFAVGFVALGVKTGDMMRYLLFLSPAMAVCAAVGLDWIARTLASRFGEARARTLSYGAGLALTLQLSASYVLPMQLVEDPRDQAGRWLVDHASPRAKVGVTRSFHGDNTYLPRFPQDHGLRLLPLMLRPNFDASRYIDLNLDYIATTDYALGHARGETAPEFLKALFHGDRHREVARFAPAWEPLSLPAGLGLTRPGDLLYVRSTFFVFEKQR
jgi:hypothetical protein